MKHETEIGRRPVKAIIIVFALFNIFTSVLYFYLSSLDKDLHGNYLSYDLGMAFRQQTVSIVGAIALIGWGMFVFYVIQVLFSKRRGTPHRPFKF